MAISTPKILMLGSRKHFLQPTRPGKRLQVAIEAMAQSKSLIYPWK